MTLPTDRRHALRMLDSGVLNPIVHARGLLDRWVIIIVCSDDPRREDLQGSYCRVDTLHHTFPNTLPFQSSVILE